MLPLKYFVFCILLISTLVSCDKSQYATSAVIPLDVSIYSADYSRFIAHAGGKIDGRVYTNSLEALDNSYSNGFRLFELDIIQTSDGVFVAAHDWEHWAKIVGYEGRLPPDSKKFAEFKIFKRYTPLTIDDINSWFKEHSDAILITDKINSPVEFSSKFIDKNRLMMELFSWDAVEMAVNTNIRSAMPTGKILDKINGDKVKYLKRLGITDISASRRILKNQKELIEQIVGAGINVYAFHVNHDKGKDEVYVVCNERSYFYGIYADQWDFDASLDCSETDEH